MITPATSLIFRVVEDKYKEQIVLQLEDIRKPGKIATKDSKITNLLILRANKKGTVGAKEMSHVLADEVKKGGLQNYNIYNKLNPVDISIRDSNLNAFLSRYNRRYKYRFIISNLLFSSSVTQGNI